MAQEHKRRLCVEAVNVKTRIAFVIGAGLGYIWGTRAGREKYDELLTKVEHLWNHPTVQSGRETVEDTVHTAVSVHVPKLAEKTMDIAKDAVGMRLPTED